MLVASTLPCCGTHPFPEQLAEALVVHAKAEAINYLRSGAQISERDRSLGATIARFLAKGDRLDARMQKRRFIRAALQEPKVRQAVSQRRLTGRVMTLDPGHLREHYPALVSTKELNESVMESMFGSGSSIFNQGEDEGEPEGPPVSQVQLLIHKVYCVDDTSELGKDEIQMGATIVTSAATDKLYDPSDVGKFKTGDSHSYSPAKVLHAQTVAPGQFPFGMQAFILLAEHDKKGFAEFLKQLYEDGKEEIGLIATALGTAAGAAIGAAIGGSVGTAVGGPIGTIIGLALGLAVGAIVGAIIKASEDEIFPPQVAILTLTDGHVDFAGSLTSMKEVLTYEDFGGHYQVTYSWKLIK